jgi:maltokinase
MTETVAGVMLQDMLAQWLPRQRWFPGRGSEVGHLTIVSDVPLLDGDGQLRHLIVEVQRSDGQARFQVLLGVRAGPPDGLGAAAVVGTRPGLVVYDALHDPRLAGALLRDIAGQRRVGPLRFVREPAARLTGLPADARLLTAEQSNTSLIFGDTVILKVLRRLFPGANPDLEVADALARLGSDQVARPFGWIETEIDGEPVLLAVLSEYLAGASDGWSLAGDALARLYARSGAYGQDYLTSPVAGRSRPPASGQQGVQQGVQLAFVAEARELGLTTAQLHSDMATAFGRRDLSPAELTGLVATLTAKLTTAVAAVPELGLYAGRIAAAYAELGSVTDPIPVQRIHGDYHLGQVMRSQRGWVALDFEGEPTAPLAERRALAPALRDVAGMLRSFDYAARHRLIGHPERADLTTAASEWVRQCQDAFCAGYAAASGADPGQQAALLRALTLEKAVYEVIYEHRYRPSWLSIPLDFVAHS